MNRREFLHTTAGFAALGSSALAQGSQPRQAIKPPMKAAVIGHTNRGRYGHGHEFVFMNRPGIETVAVADPVEGGRKKVQEAIGALRGYADYREMLERERPDFVMLALRWTEERLAMATAALNIGAHVICEKPFTHSLEDADAMVAHAKRVMRKFAVTHPMRLAPSTVFLKRRMDEGLIGELRSIRANSSQGRRSGGEDMLVQGVHMFDLLRLFAGNATEVNARILQSGRGITLADVKAGDYDKEIGPIAGDDVEAWFKMAGGVQVHFCSQREPTAPTPAGPYSLEFIGTKGAARMKLKAEPNVTVQHGSEWRALDGDPSATAEKVIHGPNRRIVDDWLAAITENREPKCSCYDGMKTVEMVQAVYAAGLSRQSVALPLKNRRHPLLG